MRGRLPNFLYLGPSKAGSTWLHEVLIRHPQVYLTEAKDLYFFDRYFDRGLDWYAGQFTAAQAHHKVVGEVCQEYLSSPEAPARIHDCLGRNARLMVTLRDPVARAFSAYLYMQKHGVFEGSFREALETRPGMLDHSRYGTLLARYRTYFDQSQIHCALFDDLVSDPQGFIDVVCDRLAVDRMVLDDSLLQARLPASDARFLPLARMVKRGATWARRHEATKLIGRVKRSPLVQRALYTQLADEQRTVAPQEAEYIRDSLYPEIVRVEEMFGVNLQERWGWAGSTS